MDLTTTIRDTIDLHSFSNIWFWIVLAAVWSQASYFGLGVPFDMLTRARRQGGAALRDVEEMVAINIRRMDYLVSTSGIWVLGLVAFLITVLVLLAVLYRIEFAQALVLLGLPMAVVGGLTVLTARRIQRQALGGEALLKRLMRHRLYIQLTGMVAIFVTAMWGMYQNLAVGTFPLQPIW